LRREKLVHRSKGAGGYNIGQAGDPNHKAYSQKIQNGLISTIRLLDERLRCSHVSDLWERENTDYAKRNTIGV
jgi:hypothetical protein